MSVSASFVGSLEMALRPGSGKYPDQTIITVGDDDIRHLDILLRVYSWYTKGVYNAMEQRARSII